VHALRGVSLEVHAGEVVALLGENGAGKSTLMRIVGGIEQPDAGEVLIDGAPVTVGGVPARRRWGLRSSTRSSTCSTTSTSPATSCSDANQPAGVCCG
jgi:ABC-type multidrug transport system ATPase subunit